MTSEESFKAREAAIIKVANTIQQPLRMMSVVDRTEAYELAVKWRMTAVDLLNAAHGKAKNT